MWDVAPELPLWLPGIAGQQSALRWVGAAPLTAFWLVLPPLYRRSYATGHSWAGAVFGAMTAVSMIGLGLDLALYAWLERVGAFGDNVMGLSFIAPLIVPGVTVASLGLGGLSVLIAWA